MSDNVAKKSINFKELIPVILKYIVLVLALLFILVPIVIIIFGGLKTR